MEFQLYYKSKQQFGITANVNLFRDSLGAVQQKNQIWFLAKNCEITVELQHRAANVESFLTNCYG